ncbi:hypothetical protein NDU88_003637 [Pleurodeles waltl]|uniref:Uncharacterized protein n=1 Tax=Pleurodeles waltl TaxID=8319 RepID=A0AAV7M4V3_PLEWA|nr:hypothetical protein NDU88_003637 [Pleurodeles waltl]
MEEERCRRRASGPGVWVEAARGVPRERCCAFRCSLRGTVATGPGLPLEGEPVGAQERGLVGAWKTYKC